MRKLIRCALGCVLVLSMTNCGNWQGVDLHLGIGTYNGAKETKTYTAEKDKK